MNAVHFLWCVIKQAFSHTNKYLHGYEEKTKTTAQRRDQLIRPSMSGKTASAPCINTCYSEKEWGKACCSAGLSH